MCEPTDCKIESTDFSELFAHSAQEADVSSMENA
jgi:hypothetical protein